MKNTSDLRKEMVKVFEKLRDSEIDTLVAKTMVATSNSILKSLAIEAEYNKFLGLKDRINFLKTVDK